MNRRRGGFAARLSVQRPAHSTRTVEAPASLERKGNARRAPDAAPKQQTSRLSAPTASACSAVVEVGGRDRCRKVEDSGKKAWQLF